MYGADSKQFFAALAAGLALAGCGSGGGGDDSGNGNTDNSGPGLPSLSIAAVSMDEGHSATGDLEFTVTLSAASTSVVSVEYSTADATADQSDYDAVDGELEIPAGDTTATIAVPVHGDTEIEADEEFTVALANPVDATVATGVAVGTIRNDDFPLLSIASATIDEGDNGDTALVFDVSMDATAIGDVTVDYATSNVVATAGDDYAGMNGTLTIPEGDVAAVVEVMISGDTDIEQDEQFVVNLLNASSNARIDEDEAIGLIVNDDFPKITIEPGSVTEADAGVRTLSFPLGLDAAAFEDLVVSYATSDDTATAGDDYVAKNGSVTVPAGNTDAKIDIETMGDTIAESTETFTVTLTGVQGGAEIEVGAAQGTILDNDTPPEDPQLIASNSSVTEGDVGTTTLRFDILLDRASNDDVRFTYATLDGTATSPDDFAAASGEATIAAGASSAAVDVLVNGDTDDEGNESFTLELAIVAGMATLATPQVSGTIVDDDDQTEPEPRLTISGASVTEGDTGTIDMQFLISLSDAAGTDVSVDYATEEDSATEGVDYTAVSGTVTLAAGDTEATIAVPVVGDNFTEDNERFYVRLSNLVGDAQLGNTLGAGTILTDEPIARVSIADKGVLEGDSGSADLVFTVSLSGTSIDDVTFDYGTSEGTATDGEDYTGVSGSGEIPAGDLSTTIPVAIHGDTDSENDENFTLTLDNLSLNATFSSALATGTIVNDETSPGWQGPQHFGPGEDPAVDVNGAGNGAVVWTLQDSRQPANDAAMAARIVGGAVLTPERIAFADSGSAQVAAIDGSGVVALWREPSIVSSVYTGGTWTAPSTVLDGINWYPGIAGSESGNAIAVWQRDPVNAGSYHNLWRAQFDPATGTFLPAELFEHDDTGHAQVPVVGMDGAGNALIVWTQSFSDSDLGGIFYDYFDAATQTWTGGTRIADWLGALTPMDIAMFGNGNAALVGRDTTPLSTEMWTYAAATDQWTMHGSASARADVQDQLTSSVVAADDNGSIWVAWLQESRQNGGWQTWANRYDLATGAWQADPDRIENAGLVQPASELDIAADAAGNLIVVWSQDVGSSPDRDIRVRAARYSAGDQAWGPAEQIDDQSMGTESRYARIAMDDTGNAVVTWQTHPEREIGANRYVAP